MKVTKISILNYIGVGAFKSSRLGKLNIIEGGNGTGKSSVLKAITEAFKSSGKNPSLIKVGSDKAEIIIEIDDNILIERKITTSSNQPKVVVDGQPLSAPQRFLNDLLGPYQFDPTAFFLAPAKERRSMLLKSLPFTLDAGSLKGFLDDPENELVDYLRLDTYDFSIHGLELLEKIASDIYDKRHEQGQIVTRLKKSLEQDAREIPETFDADKWKGFDLAATSEKVSEMRQQIIDHERSAADLEKLRNEVRSLQIGVDKKRERIERLREEIKALEAEIDVDTKEAEAIKQRGKALVQRVESFIPPNIEAERAKLAEYQNAQKLVVKLQQIEQRKTELVDEEQVHKDLDELHKMLVNDVPKKALAELKLPIKGLEIKGDEIMVQGHSIDTLSTSEQMKFAVSVARSLAGKLKVICIDRYESLDKDARKVFEAEAEKDDFEYFMTVVTSGDLTMSTVGDLSPAETTTRPRKSQRPSNETTKAAVDVGF